MAFLMFLCLVWSYAGGIERIGGLRIQGSTVYLILTHAPIEVINTLLRYPISRGHVDNMWINGIKVTAQVRWGLAKGRETQ